jgi:hypothetical protein
MRGAVSTAGRVVFENGDPKERTPMNKDLAQMHTEAFARASVCVSFSLCPSLPSDAIHTGTRACHA